jgi:hypothetical protein
VTELKPSRVAAPGTAEKQKQKVHARHAHWVIAPTAAQVAAPLTHPYGIEGVKEDKMAKALGCAMPCNCKETCMFGS